MKYCIILLTLLFTSCYNSHYNEENKYEIEKEKIICPNCNGVGKVKPSTSEKVGFAIVTFGLGLLCSDDPVICEMCNGKGFVEIPKLN